MDIWDKKKRSEVMSKIRSKNTKPEILLRKALFAKGFRYRINYKNLPGKPDIVLPKYKTVIFVHGCFWHGHDIGCIDSHIPKTNTQYWTEKITRNKERDKNNMIQILSMGWNVLTIWDCEIQQKDNIDLVIQKIANLFH
jgi:DNA mismatch endonuclease (patch repair protein)